MISRIPYLRRFFLSNLFFYIIWFKIYRTRKGDEINFFDKSTDLYVDAFPRSGNTFISHLIKNVFPQLKVVHHLHAIAPIKYALANDVPSVILIRNPLESISSLYLKYIVWHNLPHDSSVDKRLLKMFIKDYINYYKFVYNNKKKLSLIEFKELISAPEKVLSHIEKLTGTKCNNISLSNVVDSYRGTTDVLSSSLPNEVKENRKLVIKKEIKTLSEFKEATNIYNKFHSQKKIKDSIF